MLFNQVNVDFHVEAEKKCGAPDQNIAWRWANWAIRAHRVDVRLLKGGESTSTWGPRMGHSWPKGWENPLRFLRDFVAMKSLVGKVYGESRLPPS